MNSRSGRKWYQPGDGRIELQAILEATAEITRISTEDLQSRRRDVPVARSRHAFCLAAMQAGWSLTQVGRFIGRNHTSVLRAVQAAERNADLSNLARKIGGHSGSVRVQPQREITPDDELADEGVWRRTYPHMVEMYGVTAGKWREAIGA